MGALRWLTVLSLCFCHRAMGATSAPQLALERLDPTPAGDRNFGADASGVDGIVRVSGKVTVDWAHNPLVFITPKNDPAGWLVTHQIVLNLGASLALFERYLLSVDVPMNVLQAGVATHLGGLDLLPPSGFRFADIRVGARAIAYAWHPLLRLGLQGYLWFPEASSSTPSGLYTSDGHVRGRLLLLVGGSDSVGYWSVALGPDLRRHTIYFGESQGSAMRINVAGGWYLFDRTLSIGPEAYAAIPFVKPDRGNINAEALVGAHLKLPLEFVVGAGAGAGLTAGIGTPDARVVVSVATYADFVHAAPPLPPAPEPTPPPPAPEPMPLPPDPEPAPPPDVDGDGVPDVADACPAVAGIASADPNQRGCPASPPPPGDLDHDGITDDVDSCPEIPGVHSADPAKNGCSTGSVVGDQIVLLEPIKFKTNSAVILKESDATLMTVLEAIHKLDPARRLRIEGHTDSRGDRKKNIDLSERRAKAVVNWLIKHGIDRVRLSSKGFGPDNPIAKNDTEAGRQLNRRVELHIEKP